MITGFGNNCSFGLLCVSFVSFCLFVCVYLSLFCFRARYVISINSWARLFKTNDVVS